MLARGPSVVVKRRQRSARVALRAMEPDERTAALMEAEDPTTEMEAMGLPEPDLEAVRPPSILDELVARREVMARERHELVLDVPGYMLRGVNRLVVRYRYPEVGAKGLAAMEARAAQTAIEAAIVNLQIDYLVQCCDEVLTRNDAGDVERLEEEDRPALRFGKRLAELLRIDIPDEEKAKARFVCRSVFSPGFRETGVWEGDLVMTSHSQALQAWLQSIGAQTTEDFSGE